MKVVAIVGSPRKGRNTDILIDKVIEGVKEKDPKAEVEKLYLSEKKIEYCKDCLACWRSDTDGPLAKCVIRDDMDEINKHLLKADALIMGTPIHMGYASALMMTFLERICWTFAKPDKNYVIVNGCPAPRSDKKRKAVIIGVSGMIPTKYKRLCNWATPQIEGVIKDSLNAETVGKMYAGDVWYRNVEDYYRKAVKLGQKLV